jgi:membrane-associated phospholipid phosphatase
MKQKLLLCFALLFSLNVPAQEHPYHLNLKADIPVTAVCMAGTVLSYPLRDKKTAPTEAQVSALSIDQLSSFNRDAAQQFSPQADKISDVFFYSGFAIPLGLAFDKQVRSDAGTVSLMYLETMAIAGVCDGLAAGSVKKLRPYVYNPEAPMKLKLKSDAYGSFYGSHPSFTAAGAFFFAKVFSDYHPASKWRYAVWPAAGAVTLGSSYFRYKGGHHFISDIATGVGVGTAIGIAVPALHKTKNADKVSIVPTFGEYNGFAMNYRF